MLTRPRLRRRGHGDEGIVLIFVALAMIGLLLIIALVVDLSLVRSTRQTNKSAADFAVEAGLQGLNNPTGIPQPWQGVCRAIDYLKANKSGMGSITSGATYTDGAGNAKSDPCSDPTGTTFRTLCAPGDTTTWAVFTGTAGNAQVEIKSGYLVPDPSFSEDAQGGYAADVGEPTQGGCDQMAVIIRESDPATFGGVGGKTSYPTAIRSVGRLTIGTTTTDVIALLLLERTDCGALVTSGNNTFVRVARSSQNPDKQGFIHANSNGSGSNCTGSARVYQGSVYNPTNGPSIVAEDATNGQKGRVSNRAVSTANAAFSNTPSCPNPAAPTSGCTVSPDPILGNLIGRGLVDDRYLGLGSPAKRMTKLKTDASALFLATSAPAGYVDIGCPNSGTVTSATAGGPKVYMNCTLSPPPNATLTFDSSITDVVVHGSIDAKGTLVFDDVRTLYVSGTASASGTLSVNAGTSPNCTVRATSQPDHVTKMAVGHDLTATSSGTTIHLCNTFVYLGVDNPLPTTRDTAPLTNTNYVGTLNFGSSTIVDWRAPNQSSSPITDMSDPLLDSFEDLALWTEYSGNCNNSGPQLGGQGAIVATGIFFLPNACPFGIAGGGSGAAIDSDAQFIVRKLVLTGTVGLTMHPNPANAISFPVISGFALVR